MLFPVMAGPDGVVAAESPLAWTGAVIGPVAAGAVVPGCTGAVPAWAVAEPVSVSVPVVVATARPDWVAPVVTAWASGVCWFASSAASRPVSVTLPSVAVGTGASEPGVADAVKSVPAASGFPPSTERILACRRPWSEALLKAAGAGVAAAGRVAWDPRVRPARRLLKARPDAGVPWPLACAVV